MDSKAIVLIIGAGGSVPFGFPTGEQLKWAICDGLSVYEGKAIDRPLANALLKEGFSANEISELRDRLGKSGWSSVDEFLAENEDLRTVGKASIAGALLRCENRDQLFDLKDGYGNRANNWYGLLFRTIYAPFDEIARKNVRIFTYNYDQSLDTYLRGSMESSYRRPEQEIESALAHVPIVHLHGQFASHDYASGPVPVSLRKCSETISIVTEDLDGNPQFQQVEDALWKAEEIYFIGFGYDDKNLARLPIESEYPPNSSGARGPFKRPSLNIFGSAYGVEPGARRRVEDYFKGKGLKINLGIDVHDAYRFLKTTHLFGNQ